MQLTCSVQIGLRVCSATIWSVIADAGAPAATSTARSRQTARSLRSIWWMSLSWRCMSTPNGFSPLARAVISEEFRASQCVLDAADVVHDIPGVVELEDVAVTDTRAHRDRCIAERVRSGDVGFGIADDHGGVVRRHRLADH